MRAASPGADTIRGLPVARIAWILLGMVRWNSGRSREAHQLDIGARHDVRHVGDRFRSLEPDALH